MPSMGGEGGPDEVAPSPGTDAGGAPRGKREASSAAGSPSDSGAAKKLKKTGPGSRGVANLTPEQLAKKRANDREAQRAIRERTKNQIEALEKRIHELTSQQPYQELQAVVRQKELVEEENAQIKQQLASIIGMLQPMISGGSTSRGPPLAAYAGPSPVGHHGKTDAADGNWSDTRGRANSEQHYVSPPAHSTTAASRNQNNLHNSAPTPTSVASPGSVDQATSLGWQGGFASNATGRSQQRARTGPKQCQEMPERLGLGFLIDADHQVSRIPSGAYGPQDTPQHRGSQAAPPKPDDEGGYEVPQRAHQSSTASGNWDGVRYSSTPHHHQQQQQQQLPYHHHNQDAPSPDHQLSRAAAWYAAPVKNCEPTCILDGILLDFLGKRRRLAAEGHPLSSVVGPAYPSVSSLLNPSNSDISHPLSKIFTDMMRTFPDLKNNLPESVAVVFIMFIFMRWQVDPTEDNYRRLPRWMQPSDKQRHIPHPAWIDHLPFPEMRDRLVTSYTPDQFHFQDFFVPFTQTLRLSWPYMSELVVMTDGIETVINPVFETHLRDLSNWKLGPAFTQRYPTLADTISMNVHNLPSNAGSSTPGSTRTD